MIFPIKAMIFDADGVLLDSLSVWKELGKRYITDLGYQPVAGMAYEDLAKDYAGLMIPSKTDLLGKESPVKAKQAKPEAFLKYICYL